MKHKSDRLLSKAHLFFRLLWLMLGSGTWHSNNNDPKEHLTVDFKTEDGTHITTHHVYRS